MTLTLIRVRINIDAASKWWRMVETSPRCTVEWIDSEDAACAMQWFFGWKDQSFSFTDCTSFALMRRLGIQKVLTGDRHFITAGFQTVP